MKKMLISLTLCASLLLPLFPLRASATISGAGEEGAPSAELALSPNGTKGIVSMTFDDGSIPTAEWLNEKFKEYNLYGSTMLITSKNLSSSENVETWKKIYADGHIAPESHSYTHLVLPTEYWASKNNIDTLNNNTDDNFYREIYQSGKMIEDVFGVFPLCFAPSNNTMSEGGMRYVMQYYYAMRQGSRYGSGEIQSLDPTPGSSEKGGWYNLLMSGTKDAEEKILEGLNTAAREGGWLVVMCHGIGESSGDSTYEKFEPVLSRMSALQESGTVWVTTFGEATKYIRQRQNTTVHFEKGANGAYTLSLTMAEETADGLALPAERFNLPLTVRVRLPEGATHMAFTLGASEELIEGMEEDGVRYALVNMRAGIDNANIRFCNNDGVEIVSAGLFTLKQGATFSDAFTYTLYIKDNGKLVGANIAGGDYIEARNIPKTKIENDDYFALSYTPEFGQSPLAFDITLYVNTDRGSGVCTVECSLLSYLGALLTDEQDENTQITALCAMVLLRDLSNKGKLGVDTTCVQDAIMQYHYLPKAPDSFKNAPLPDTSVIHASLAYDLPNTPSLVLTPDEGISCDAFSFFGADGEELEKEETGGVLYVSLPALRALEDVRVVYTSGDEAGELIYSLAADYQRISHDYSLSNVYISFYHTLAYAKNLAR